MRIKTRYLLFTPFIMTMLIAMINVTIVFINNNNPEYKLNIWQEFGVFCYFIVMLIGIVFGIIRFIENWDHEFKINLKFNKNEE